MTCQPPLGLTPHLCGPRKKIKHRSFRAATIHIQKLKEKPDCFEAALLTAYPCRKGGSLHFHVGHNRHCREYSTVRLPS